ncbi:hypothetical protein MC7420_7187 [Coleofasciculus chthonoplastes PCC 7420]|uniref:MrpA C-terminal/MbhD domain-containing protein n=1 Tax=Coleofasciculus chthonoplastes PCC 7420 TaxID=118168 RepID=B4VHC5_9CYAN|nr:DUF4040 domain-containing protein [Coleofasciculus chthonoplastes]EDX78534.1 hypothetical protein MC7420_7187 [Coleofasciculus chthonoplastes PCC 7420]
MNQSDIYVIIALLPLAACMLVFQVNPYHALVIRGILGAVAALVYAVLGAADVALTEALVGTMLAITLYAVAVRSSLTLRLGVLEESGDKVPTKEEVEQHFGELMNDLRRIFSKHYMRVELVPYTDQQALHRALMEKEVHATCTRSHLSELEHQDPTVPESETPSYHTATRVQRLYDIIRTELSSAATHLTYINTPDSGEKH